MGVKTLVIPRLCPQLRGLSPIFTGLRASSQPKASQSIRPLAAKKP